MRKRDGGEVERHRRCAARPVVLIANAGDDAGLLDLLLHLLHIVHLRRRGDGAEAADDEASNDRGDECPHHGHCWPCPVCMLASSALTQHGSLSLLVPLLAALLFAAPPALAG